MSNPKWEIEPVKLENEFDAAIFLFDEIRKVYLGAYRLPGCGLYALVWREDGNPIDFAKGYNLAPPLMKAVRVRCWLNIDASGMVGLFTDREDADKFASANRIACIEIDREVTEGEGL